MKATLVVVAWSLISTAALGQSHTHGASPYAGQQQREIKALSAEQVAELRAGAGMSMALPAELNGYPGPRHVLELAELLRLTDAQRARTHSIMSEMKRNAVELGDRLIESERRLDALFASGNATAEKLGVATTEAASLQGRLRAVHLGTHLEMKRLLTAEQAAHYEKLRGYGDRHAMSPSAAAQDLHGTDGK
jgi:Spy/CpxP family protein refolding chaperone